MDLILRCNIIKCRKVLDSKAYVTSCSHVFCSDCASKSLTYALVCPACENPLSATKDIYYADLKPSEEWKSLVISGQKPEIISEICSRATSFWSYQIHQEHSYNEMVLRSMHEKWNTTERQYQNVVIQLQAEISSLSDKSCELSKQVEIQKRKEAEMLEQVTDKNRQLKKLQVLYDKLRMKESNENAKESLFEFELNNGKLHHSQLQEIPINSVAKSSWLEKWKGTSRAHNENIENNSIFVPISNGERRVIKPKNVTQKDRNKNSYR